MRTWYGMMLGLSLAMISSEIYAQAAGPGSVRSSDVSTPMAGPTLTVQSQVPGQAEVPQPGPTYSHWYGWQTLTADGAAASIGIVAMALHEKGALTAAGVGTYLIGAPIVHLAHDRPWTALGSLGLRSALPLVGLMMGAQTSSCEPAHDANSPDLSGFCAVGGAIIGFGVGAVTAAALDAIFLAREDRTTTESKNGARSSLFVGPMVSADTKRAGLMLSGGF